MKWHIGVYEELSLLHGYPAFFLLIKKLSSFLIRVFFHFFYPSFP